MQSHHIWLSLTCITEEGKNFMNFDNGLHQIEGESIYQYM